MYYYTHKVTCTPWQLRHACIQHMLFEDCMWVAGCWVCTPPPAKESAPLPDELPAELPDKQPTWTMPAWWRKDALLRECLKHRGGCGEMSYAAKTCCNEAHQQTFGSMFYIHPACNSFIGKVF